MSANAAPESRMCPILTASSVGQGEKSEAVACQGSACMWYMPVQNAQGQPLPGQCAMFQCAIGLSLVNVSIRQHGNLDSPLKKKV